MAPASSQINKEMYYYFYNCCDQIPNRKQVNDGRVSLGSQLEGPVHDSRKVVTAGM